MTAEHSLDNPIWNALDGAQQHLAETIGIARRYHPDVASFAAIPDRSPRAWSDLGRLIGRGVPVILSGVDAFAPPDGWEVLRHGPGFQMVLDREPAADDAPGTRPLTDDDVPAMIELVALTEPGPFRPRAIEFGGYVGVFDGDRLVAMAGRRTAVDGFVEISAVCTHPDARRRGLGAAVTATVARGIIADGLVPILHVAEPNAGAKAVYDKLGFVTRTSLFFAAFRLH